MLVISCTKEVTLDLEDVEDVIAVNCLFTDVNYFKVLVAKSTFYGDTLDHFVFDAVVTIKAQNSNTEKELAYQGNGYYFDTTYYPKYNETYILSVDVPGYKTLSAVDSLPVPPDIKNVYLISTDKYDIDLPNYRYHDIYITLNDPLNTKNFYEMICFDLSSYETSFIIRALESDDPIIVKEGDQNYYHGPLLLNDELIDGRSFEFKVNTTFDINHDSVEWNTAFHIAGISETLYKYRKQEIRHNASGYALWNPIEPVPMYSNITNGLGIFAGYSARCFLLHHENK
ncbi:MAG: DUF4249 domain-containing protein [Prolixibacteraceae bacterium]|nr:DUF4249 domain-containing protein [Prolixibacteraceae bacterium]